MGTPRYVELAQRLMREIADGTLPVGSRLPSEVELAERHGLSRTTVRSALDLVEELGLVSRRRKLGTVVEATRPRAEYVASMTTLQELIQYAEQTERVLHSVDHVVCDAGLARRLECAPGDGWMHVTMTRVEPQRRDSPICVTDVYLEPELGHAVRDQLSRPDGLICSMVEQRSGRLVVSITQSFRAVLLTERQAELVNAPPRSAGLEITRHYRDRLGVICQITISTHPADRFTYRFDLRRDPGVERGVTGLDR
ncbi:transcriptional regulator, GntR family [Pseudonocardia thermophila]|uniref:Transcriptional regulator, GntR family n=1 Tax=Pseudonocardia thermophila TaxID=1848 RepID=A0A1M6XIP0_PSETH|nr:GntR family transcriptional regulator [Pseudonocardia thermophila]SHL05852.1 transcriptional regulator, GntR family [Pseudonocardia thermophila]